MMYLMYSICYLPHGASNPTHLNEGNNVISSREKNDVKKHEKIPLKFSVPYNMPIGNPS